MEILTLAQKKEYLTKLLELTKADRVPWVEDEQMRQFSFYAILGTTTVWIYSGDGDDLHPYILTIDPYSPDTDIRSVTEIVEITSGSGGTEDDTGLNELLAELYLTVKRKVLNIDHLHQRLFGDLEELS
jgi:hypothetical protein